MQSLESHSFPKANSFDTTLVRSKIMGPNPLKLCEELLRDADIPRGASVCDLGSGTGITSALLAREYGLTPTPSICGVTPSRTERSSIRLASRLKQFIPYKPMLRRVCYLSMPFSMRS